MTGTAVLALNYVRNSKPCPLPMAVVPLLENLAMEHHLPARQDTAKGAPDDYGTNWAGGASSVAFYTHSNMAGERDLRRRSLNVDIQWFEQPSRMA